MVRASLGTRWNARALICNWLMAAFISPRPASPTPMSALRVGAKHLEDMSLRRLSDGTLANMLAACAKKAAPRPLTRTMTPYMLLPWA